MYCSSVTLCAVYCQAIAFKKAIDGPPYFAARCFPESSFSYVVVVTEMCCISTNSFGLF